MAEKSGDERALRRSDRSTPRVLPQDKMEYYCELIAALKVRTSNKKGRHLSTGEAIRLITLVETTLSKKEVIEQVEEYFGRRTERESPC
jgi:hypothetical protein